MPKHKRKPTFVFGRRQWVEVNGELDYRRIVSLVQENTKEQAEEEYQVRAEEHNKRMLEMRKKRTG